MSRIVTEKKSYPKDAFRLYWRINSEVSLTVESVLFHIWFGIENVSFKKSLWKEGKRRGQGSDSELARRVLTAE